MTFLVSKYLFFQPSRAKRRSRDTVRFLCIRLPVAERAVGLTCWFFPAHLGSCGVCFETAGLSPCEATPASSTPAASSDLSPASVLPLILLLAGKQRRLSHTIANNSKRVVDVIDVYAFCDEWEPRLLRFCGRPMPSVELDRERRSQQAAVTPVDSVGM